MKLFQKSPVLRWGVAIVLLLLLAAGGFFLIRYFTDPYDCRMAPGVTMGGIDVGGMTKGEARKALERALEQTLYATDLQVILPEETLILSPEQTKPRVDVRLVVNAAYRYGRKPDHTAQQVPILPFLEVEEDYIRQLLSDYAAKYDTVLTQPSWTLEGPAPELSTQSYDPDAPGQTLLLTLGLPELYLDVNEAYGTILAEYNRAILDCESGSFTVTPEVAPEALPEAPDLEAIYAQYAVEAVNDGLSLETYQMVYGSYGYGFDVTAAAALVEKGQFGETLSIPMAVTQPEILGEAVYYRDILGSCETPHNNNENRNTNLRLVCQILDGFILQPGEEFSYNAVIGERTAERGFKAAPAYSGDRLIQDIGGGVCQGSSTLYNCALLADLEVTDRVCHGFTVNYLPIGLDAAVNWNTDTDLKFINNTHFPIMFKAEVSDGYMKMKMLGTDEKDYYIEMRSSRSEDEHRIYSNSYKYKYDKETGELISKDLEARSAYMHYDK